MLETADAAAKAYHAIADTPIKQLQTDEGAQMIGDLVTNSRDLYRQWQSHGPIHSNIRPKSFNYGEVVYTAGNLAIPPNLFYNTHNIPATAGRIMTNRGLVMFSGPTGQEKLWTIHEPFREIMVGDQMQSIPALIGRIKR